MPDFSTCLQGKDLSSLQIIARFWGIEFHAPDARLGAQRLAVELLRPELVNEVISSLPEEAKAGLVALQRYGGRLPWSLFTRRYGNVREMGASKREREKPYQVDPSPAEMLWYRALIGRAFFNTSSGLEELAYIPDELLALLPEVTSGQMKNLSRPASPVESAYIYPCSDAIVDDVVTTMAALRSGHTLEWLEQNWPDYQLTKNVPIYPLTFQALHKLLVVAGLVSRQGELRLSNVAGFLQMKKGEALAFLGRVWLESQDYNELHMLPGIVVEGQWKNNPLSARHTVIKRMRELASGLDEDPGSDAYLDVTFWNLKEFVSFIRREQPDFQRPAGDYDSWFLRRQGSDEFLRGFEHWDEVDGELIRLIICGPLYWLGFCDLAAPDKNAAVAAFRFSGWSRYLFRFQAPPIEELKEEKVILRADGRLEIPYRSAQVARYQLSRFVAWEGRSRGMFRYRITPGALENARKQGLKTEQFITLLRRYVAAVPPRLVNALQRWERQGNEARFEQPVLLRFSSPELLRELRQSPTGRFLGEPLSPTVVIVKPGAWKKLASALLDLGVLCETSSLEANKKAPE